MCSQWHLFLSRKCNDIIFFIHERCLYWTMGHKEEYWVVGRFTQNKDGPCRTMTWKCVLRAFGSETRQSPWNEHCPTWMKVHGDILDYRYVHVFVLYIQIFARKKALQILWASLHESTWAHIVSKHYKTLSVVSPWNSQA